MDFLNDVGDFGDFTRYSLDFEKIWLILSSDGEFDFLSWSVDLLVLYWIVWFGDESTKRDFDPYVH